MSIEQTLLSVFSLIVSFVGVFMIIAKNQKIKKLTKKRTADMLVDLELATSEQLFLELKRRNTPFLLLRPNQENELNLLSLTVSNIQPEHAVKVLGTATALTIMELKKRGYDFDPPEGFISESETEE